MDFEEIASGDAAFDEFLGETGYVDEEAGPILEEDDDNNNLNVDLDLDDFSVDEDLSLPPDIPLRAIESTMKSAGLMMSGPLRRELRQQHVKQNVLSPLGLPWMSQDCSEQELLMACVASVDPASKALCAVDSKMRESGLLRNEFHRQMSEAEPLLDSKAPVRAHMDGGSMATTMHREDLVWHMTPVKNPPALRVADDYAHYPTHKGYLRVPVLGGYGYRMMETFLTPSLHVTILSPDACGKQLQCGGYSSVSNFNGVDCQLELRHCK